MVSKEQLLLIIQADNLVSKVVQTIGGDVEKFQKQLKSLKEETLTGLQDGFKKTVEVMKTMGVVAALSVAAISSYGIGLAISYESQLSNIKALTGATSEQMKQVSDLSMVLGAKTKFSALEAAQGAEELLKAGVSLSEVMGGGLAGALDLAAAGAISVADAAEIASTVLNAFKRDNLNVSQAADILAGAANASATSVGELKFALSMVSAVAAGVGLSFKDTSTALAVFAQNGLKGSDAGTSLKTMLMNLQPQTKGQMAAFDELGITTDGMKNKFFTAEGKIQDLATISQVLKSSLGDLTDQQRIATLETLFGSDAIRAGNILFAEGAEGVNKMATEMTKFTAASVAAEKTNNLAGAFERLQGTIDTQLIKVFSEPLPEASKWIGKFDEAIQKIDVKSLAEGLAKSLTAIENFITIISANYQAVVIALSAITGAWVGLNIATLYFSIVAAGANLGVTGLIPSLIAMAAAGWAAVAPFLPFIAIGMAVAAVIALLYFGFSENFLGIRDIAQNVLNWLVEFFIWAWNNISSGAMWLWNQMVVIWTAISSAVGSAINVIWGIITTVFGGMWTFISMIFNTILVILSAVFLTIVALFTGNSALLSEVWAAFWMKIQAIWGGAFSAIGNGISAFLNWLLSAWNSAVSGLWAILWQLPGFLISLFVWMFQVTREGGERVWSAITGGFKAATDLVVKAFDVIKNINLVDMGKNIIQGLIDGIWKMASSLGDSIKSVVNGAIDAAKGVLGIKSPSRVFMALADYSIQGWVKGVDQGMSKVDNSTEMMATAAIPSIETLGSSNLVTTNNSSSSTISDQQNTMIVNIDARGALIDDRSIEQWFSKIKKLADNAGFIVKNGKTTI